MRAAHRRNRPLFVTIIAVLLLATAALPALADHATRPSQGLRALGHSAEPAQFLGVPAAERHVSSDIAFWGSYAIQGNYDGFRVIDISSPRHPREVSRPTCNGDQGDVVVWDNIVVRSWNSPAPEGRFCDGQPVPVGFEGLHIFDISDVTSPVMVAAIPLDCGSHTSTAVPDLANDRLIVYSNVSSGGGNPACDAMDVVSVPLGNPAATAAIGKVALTGGSLGSNNGCHDASAILGDVNMLVCASGHAANVFSIGAPRGGTLENPQFLYTIEEEDGLGNKVGVGGRWHSSAFTWDGKVIAMGWEPGGGAAPECEATDPDIKKSMFFYDADTGAKLGQWVLPRPQTADENCTVHNFNVLPLHNGRYIAVSGNYQAGTWITEFTDPANPVTLAFSDPAPVQPVNLAGAWSSYFYNGNIYESEIQTGLNVFRAHRDVTSGALPLSYLNPQTQQFSLP